MAYIHSKWGYIMGVQKYQMIHAHTAKEKAINRIRVPSFAELEWPIRQSSSTIVSVW
jgi:hypothetical protein